MLGTPLGRHWVVCYTHPAGAGSVVAPSRTSPQHHCVAPLGSRSQLVCDQVFFWAANQLLAHGILQTAYT